MPVCEDLQPVLDWLGKLGIKFVEVKYRNYPRYLLSETIDLDRLKREVPLPKHVLTSPDLMNGRYGLTCVRHHQSVVWPVPAVPEPEFCEHLRPVVDVILSAGNVVSEKTTFLPHSPRFQWTLQNWVDYGALVKQGCVSPQLNHWVNTDAHYPLAEGLTCHIHDQSIVWPLKDFPKSKKGMGTH